MALWLVMDESDYPQPQVRITPRLIDALYTEAMLLADEARHYFDDVGRNDRTTLEPPVGVGERALLLGVGLGREDDVGVLADALGEEGGVRDHAARA